MKTPTLHFELVWADPPGEQREAGRALAWGAGILYVGDDPVWFAGSADAPKPVSWSWIELLEFLGARWLHLTTEQAYPLGITVDDPREFRTQATRVLGSRFFEGSLSDEADEEVFRFEGRHDLARALRGISLPSVFVMREREPVMVSTDHGVVVADRRELLNQLQSVGDAISARAAQSQSERAKAAVKEWQGRRAFDAKQLIRLASGNAKVGAGTLEYWELANEPGADSELAAAARFMAGAIPSTQDFDIILTTIRARPSADCSKLDEAARALQSILDEPRYKDPYEQGYALAAALRNKLSISDDKAVEIERIVHDFGVEIIDQTLSPAIDGVGCWGNRHGPAIVVNLAGRRSGKTHGRRATVSQRLFHLLAGRSAGLPPARVIGGASPYLPDRRPNAFAAAFLLPPRQLHKTL